MTRRPRLSEICARLAPSGGGGGRAPAGSRMFRPKTVSAHCNRGSAETSVSAIVEVRSECAETSCAETSVLTCVLYIILELFVLLAYYLRCLSFHCE